MLWLDPLGNQIVTSTNGASQVYFGRSQLVNGGITGLEAGVPWNVGYFAAAGVPTNSSTGDLGTLTFSQLATVLGVFGTTNSIFGGTFGTNVDTGQTTIDAQGNISHNSTNATLIRYGAYGTNGTPNVLSIYGTNQAVVVGPAATIYGNGSGLTNVNGNVFTDTNSVFAPIGQGAPNVAFGTTIRFVSPWGSTTAGATTEANVSVPSPQNCHIKNLYLRCNAGTSTNLVVSLYTNGVASNLLVSMNGTGSFQTASDTTHSVPVLAGTLLSFSFLGNNPTAPAASVVSTFSALMTP